MKNVSSFFLIFFLILLSNCSFDNKSGIWKEHNKKIIKKAKNEEKVEKIFKKNKIFDEEVRSTDIVIISKEKENFGWLEDNLNSNNDVSHLKYQNNKDRILKSKKIGKRNHSLEIINSDPLVFEENIYFSDLNGNIY